MRSETRIKRLISALVIGTILIIGSYAAEQRQQNNGQVQPLTNVRATGPAADALKTLTVKGRAPKTGYSRSNFGPGWDSPGGCSVRERILQRDLTDITLYTDGCRVITGTLHDPYTGKTILFLRGESTSQAVQIDHVVALSDSWQKGAQQLSYEDRVMFANDPLELLAVDGAANQNKGDGDAATWLPVNKDFRCAYVARQISVKVKYNLWVTQAELNAMTKVLSACPDEPLPSYNTETRKAE